jgi:hypothetical protein
MPKKFSITIVRVTIKGIRGAVIQSSFLINNSYKPYPITAMKGIATGRTSDRKLSRPNASTPIPESKRDNSPIVKGGLVIPIGMLIKLKIHINIPIRRINRCLLMEN